MKMIDTGTIVTKMIEKALEKQSSYWLSPAEDTIYDDTTMQLWALIGVDKKESIRRGWWGGGAGGAGARAE